MLLRVGSRFRTQFKLAKMAQDQLIQHQTSGSCADFNPSQTREAGNYLELSLPSFNFELTLELLEEGWIFCNLAPPSAFFLLSTPLAASRFCQYVAVSICPRTSDRNEFYWQKDISASRRYLVFHPGP